MCAKQKAKPKTDRNNNLLFSQSFFSDLYMDNMYYASIVRSPEPKGIIKKIHIDQLPPEYTFLGWSDLTAKKNIKILNTEIPVFCKKQITYLGQPIGIITGPDRKTVRLLSKSIKIDIEDDYSVEESDEKDNILAQREIHFGSNYELKDGEIEVCEEWQSNINIQNYSETSGCICYVKGSSLYVSAPSLWTSNLREALSDITGFPEQNIFITQTKLLTRNSSVLWLNSVISCQCAVAAITLKRPVKLEYTRTEQRIYGENTSSVKIVHKTAVSPDGIIKNMDVQIHVNAGAYNPFAQELADRLSISSTSVYNCPNVKITTNIYRSHSIPSSIDFTIIDSKAFFAMESQINKIAAVTGLDPLELRSRNLKLEGKHKNSNIQLETGKAQEALDAVCAKSIFLRKNAAYKTTNTNRFKFDSASPYAPPLRGVGLACAYEGTGYLGSNFIKKNINLELTYAEDKKLYIHGLPASHSIWKIWVSLASSITGIPPQDIILDTSFNHDTEPENPQTTQASISINTQLIKKACEGLKAKINKNEALPITIKKNFKVNSKKNWDEKNFCGYPFSSTSFAAMIIELEMDSAIYKPVLRGIWFIVDAGKILNAKSAETSIKNSIQEGLRELIDDDEIEASSISIQFMQSDVESKQIGDVVNSILPAAFASALSQCIGKTITRMPVQTDTVYKLTEILKQQYLSELKKAEEATDDSENTGDVK